MYRIGLIPNVIPIAFILQNSRFRKFPGNLKMVSLVIWILQVYTHFHLYNNKINARALIGQSAVVYCAGKPMEKSRVFLIII